MDWYTSVFELIDMRSFSNLWYWIALAVVWATASHRVLGVPYDMVLRARRAGGQAEADLDDIARVQVNRLLYIASVSGIWILGVTSFLLTCLAVLAVWYRIEFAQALLLMVVPMSGVGLLGLSRARHIDAQCLTGKELQVQLMRQRIVTQVIGTISIFVTALWGMYQNSTIGVLGG